MELQHVNVKLLVHEPESAAVEALVPVFHGWIQEHAAPELLIDIADYRHVPDGPGVMLIGHEADYSLDHGDGVWGVRYNRKAVVEGDSAARLQQSARAALEACRRIEADTRLEGKIRFNGRGVEIFVNDRLLAPNDAATRAEFEAELTPLLQKLLAGSEYTLAFPDDPRRLLKATVTAARPFSVEELLGNV